MQPERLGEVDDATFLRWLTLTSACGFGLYLAWTLGLLQSVLQTDLTQISAVIILIYLGCAAFGGWTAQRLSRAHRALLRLRRYFDQNGQLPPGALPLDWPGEYCRGLRSPRADRAALREILEERVRNGLEASWFVSNLLLKLGLLGTIVGFVFMLGALDALKTLTYADLPQMLGRMGSGMGVSLYTTLVGLLANMVLGVQNLMMDRSAERLIAGTLQFAEQDFLPRMESHEAPG